jgi:hypothetical protein
MDDTESDRLFIKHAFQLIAAHGWPQFGLMAAATASGLPPAQIRARFPNRSTLLLRFGRLADQAALAETETDGSVRDRLFALIMRRIDALQAHRDGVIALLRALPTDPPTALLLNCASTQSMRWLLDAAGVSVGTSVIDHIRVKGLLAVWLYTVNAWRRDESADLATTMAALDTALSRAERAATWLPNPPTTQPPPPNPTLPPALDPPG